MAESIVLNDNSFINIERAPWKVWMNPAPTKPTASLLNLYDLIVSNDADKSNIIYWADSFSATMTENDDIDRGIPFGHDLMIYKDSVYNNDGSISPTTTEAEFGVYGVQCGVPMYDKRAKPQTIDVQSLASSTSDKNLKLFTQNLLDLKIYKKEAAFFPKNTFDLYEMNIKGSNSNTTLMGEISNFRVSTAVASTSFWPSVGTESRPTACNSAVMLSGIDLVFKTSMVFEDGKSAWTRIALNPNTTYVQYLVLQAFMNASSFVGTSEQVTQLLAYFQNGLLKTIISGTDTLCQQLQYFLKNTYIWVKLAAAADYVDPEDFNQNLNQNSDVQFSNILAARKGNYNRYDELSSKDSTTADTGSSADSLPYIPKNAPLKDFLTEELVAGATDTSVAGKMKYLIEEAEKPDSSIGSVLSEAYAQSGTAVGINQNDPTSTQVSPFMFFDPDLKKSADEYTRVPVVIPKGGNILSESRVFGPAQDEIWYMIKKIISARDSDDNNETDFTRSRGSDKTYNEIDTSMKEVNSTFDFTYNGKEKTGDPIDFTTQFYDSGKIKALLVKEFLTQPSQEDYIVYTDNLASETEIKSWAKDGYIGLSSIDIDGITRSSSKLAAKTGKWAPRTNPLSLRELESRTLGNKFAIVCNFKFIVRNFALVGGLGYNYIDNGLKVDGTLYQLHKDYNFNSKAPNTFFEVNGKKTGTFNGKTHAAGAGADIEFYDIDALDPISQEKESSYVKLSELRKVAAKTIDKSTAKKKTTKLPGYADSYGASAYTKDDQNEYSSAQVYMGADGAWHYIHEQVRAPILRSRFI